MALIVANKWGFCIGSRILVSVSVCDSAHRQVVWADFDLNSVTGHDSDVVHSHLSAYVGQDFEVSFVELDAKSSIGKILEDCSIELDSLLLTRLVSNFLFKVSSTRHESTVYQYSEKCII